MSLLEVLGKREVEVAPIEFSVSTEAVQGIKNYYEDAHAYYSYIGITYPKPGTPRFKSGFREQAMTNADRALDTYSFFKELVFQLESPDSATLTPVRSKGLRPKTIDTALIPGNATYCRIGEERLNDILGLIYPDRDGYKKQKEIRGILSKGKTVRLIAPKK
jgi:hypothetical protein